MTTVKYWGGDLSFNENPISSEVLAKLIEMVHTARERAINASLDVDNNLTSATALLLIEKMYDATKYDTSDIPNLDTPLNVTLNIFNHVYKLRLVAKYEEHFRKVAKEYNTAAKRIDYVG